MCVFERQQRSWGRRLGLALGTLALLAATVIVAHGQTITPLLRVLDVKRSTMQQEVSRLAADNFDIALARLDPGLLIAHRSRETGPRTYLFVDDVQTFLSAKRLERGFRLLPLSLSRGGKPYCAVFEKRADDDQPREYAFVKGSGPGDLEKNARKSLSASFVPVAINTEGEAIAVFEQRADAPPWKLLATASTGTMDKELAAAAAEGYRVVASSGGAELAYVMVQDTGSQPAQYRFLSTTRASTLERELNEAAGNSFHFVPLSLASLRGGVLFRASNEVAIVVEKSAATPSISYRVVGARRVSTIENEALAIASEGFAVVAALLGHEETVVILASPQEATITVR
jgi:hypothetical protein